LTEVVKYAMIYLNKFCLSSTIVEVLLKVMRHN